MTVSFVQLLFFLFWLGILFPCSHWLMIDLKASNLIQFKPKRVSCTNFDAAKKSSSLINDLEVRMPFMLFVWIEGAK